MITLAAKAFREFYVMTAGRVSPVGSQDEWPQLRCPQWAARRMRYPMACALCRCALGVGLLGACFALTATSASAAQTHLFESSFGPDGTAASVFDQPREVAVDQSSGAIYVGDATSGTIEKFDAAHEPEPFTAAAANLEGKLTGFAFGSPAQLAASATSHDFYFASPREQAVKAFQSDGEPALFTAGSDAGTNELKGPEPCGVAVDASNDIYVSFEDGVHVYAETGEPLTVLPKESLTGFPCQLAVDSAGTLYVNLFGAGVEKLTPEEFPLTAHTEYASDGIVDANAAFGVAVDPATNVLYVDEHTQIAEYNEGASKEEGVFGTAEPGTLAASAGVAVNAATGQVYVSDAEGKHQVEIFGPAVVVPTVATGAATEVNPKPPASATLNGTVNPEGIEVTDCHFDYGPSTAFGQMAPCEQTVGSGSGDVAVTAKLTGLQAGVTYHFRLQASNTNGPSLGADATFSTPPKPAITGENATNLTASSNEVSGDLNASVTPGGLEVTSCTIELGISSEYGHAFPCSPQPGSGTSPVSISQHVEGLDPNTTYHWRVVASSEAGTTTSPDHTFIYDQSAKGVLPDNRAYEMVTPPQKNGAQIGNGSGSGFALSEDGTHLIANAIQCFGGAPSCPVASGTLGSLFEFTRTTGGWVTEPLSPPAETLAGSNNGSVHLNLNPDNGMALYAIPTPPQGEEDLYARDPGGTFRDIGPLIPPAQGYTVESLKSLGDETATADLSHVVFREGPFWPSISNKFDQEPSQGQLLEYVGTGNTQPLVVGVSGGAGSTDLISACDTATGQGRKKAGYGAMSVDGRVVYFNARGCKSGTGTNAGVEVPVEELFARIDNSEPDAHTIAISQPRANQTLSSTPPDEACISAGCDKNITEEANWRNAEFVGASSDGSKVVFDTEQQLTDGATQGSNNMYLYDSAAPVGHGLVDVSQGEGGSPVAGGPRVQGIVALSNDGSHAYLVAKGVLTGTPNALGKTAQSGADNLYLFVHESGQTSGHAAFIATLPQADEKEWTQQSAANVTPGGRYLVFTSHGALTTDVTRTDGAAQVFRYDAVTENLVRLSVGERGFNDNGNGGLGDAAIVPVSEEGETKAGEVRTDPTMSHDASRIFFLSSVGLVPGALNDVPTAIRSTQEYAQNVYEWEQAGTSGGSCPEGAPGGGCVYLISDGHDSDASFNTACEKASAACLYGTDATGSNVFFSAVDRLLPQDTDTELDIYDARICTAASPCTPPAAGESPLCLGEGCRAAPPSRAGSSAGPTATFSGAGNLVPSPTTITTTSSKPACSSSLGAPAKKCTRTQNLKKALAICKRKYPHSKKKRGSCEATARTKYGPVKTKKAAKKGSTHRRP